MLKKLLLVASIIYTLTLLTVCLINLNNAPKIEISHGDKIFHFLTYCVLTVLWVYTFVLNFNWPKKKSILVAGIGAVLFGMLIEVLQGSLTSTRTFDYYDALANSLGALTMSLLLIKKRIVS